MNEFNNAISGLSKKYSIVAEPIYLSKFFEPNGETLIYEELKKAYKESYNPDERIVIVQDCNDEYNYDNLPGRSLTFIQKCLQSIDISNWFVVVVTGKKDIESDLEILKQNNSTDQHRINYVLVDTTYERKLSQRDTFCVMPWIHLYVHTNGDVLPCCSANTNFPLGSIQSEDIEGIINNEKFQKIRDNMIHDKLSIECENCINDEKAGLRSQRQKRNNEWGHLVSKEKLNTTIDNFEPVFLDLRFSNICNLKCRTCSGDFSSQIAVEEKVLFGTTHKSLILHERDLAFEKVLPYLKSAERIYFAGGEPLILAEHYKILEHLLKLKKNNIRLEYNTNLTTLSYKNKNVLSLWKQFTNIKVNASIDGHGSVVEYIRYGCKWSELENNLKEIKTQCPHIKIAISSTVSLLSIVSIMELQRMWHNKKFIDVDQFQLGLMSEGSQDDINLYLPLYNIQNLPDNHKKYISHKIDDHCSWLNMLEKTDMVNQWENINNYMHQKDRRFVIDNLKEVHQRKDKYRNENFDEVFPEFQGLFL